MIFKYGYNELNVFSDTSSIKLGLESIIDGNVEDIEFSENYAALESCVIDTFSLENEVVAMEADAVATLSSSDKKAWYKKFYEWIKSLGSRISDFFMSAYRWIRRKLFGDPESPAKVNEVVKETAAVIEDTAKEVEATESTKEEPKAAEPEPVAETNAKPKELEKAGPQARRQHNTESIKELARKNIEKHPTISKLSTARKVQIVNTVVKAVVERKSPMNFWVFSDEVTKRINFQNSSNVYRGSSNNNSTHSGLFNVVMYPAYALKSLMEIFYGIKLDKDIPDVTNGTLEPIVELLTDLDKNIKNVDRSPVMKEITYEFILNENGKISKEELNKFYKTYGETVQFAANLNKFMTESDEALKRVREKTKALKETDFTSYIEDGKDPKVILKNFQTSGRLIASISKVLFKHIRSDIKVRSGVTKNNYNSLDVDKTE